MANEKKVVADATIEEKEDVIEATKTKTKKATTEKVELVEEVKDNRDLEIETLKKQNEELMNNFNKLMEQMQKLALNNSSQQPIVIQQPKEKKYRIINLTDDHNVMTIKTNSQKYDMKGYGTSRMFNEEDFKDVYSLQRKFFFYGALTTDTEGLKFLEEIGYIQESDIGKNITGVYLTKQDLETLPEISVEELTNLYKRLHPKQQEIMVDAFLEGVEISDKKGFKDLEKVTALNNLYSRNNKYKERLKNAVLKVSENK